MLNKTNYKIEIKDKDEKYISKTKEIYDNYINQAFWFEIDLYYKSFDIKLYFFK